MKGVNRYTSNEFHDWQRSNLPGRFVIQDIDTWSIVVSDSDKNYEPLALIELKRSFIDPRTWRPFVQDKPNYLALFKLSKRSEIPLWVIYFTKEMNFFSVFKINDVKEENTGNWIEYENKIMTPDEFKRDFPNIFGD